jgi:hypothetical protein
MNKQLIESTDNITFNCGKLAVIINDLNNKAGYEDLQGLLINIQKDLFLIRNTLRNLSNEQQLTIKL